MFLCSFEKSTNPPSFLGEFIISHNTNYYKTGVKHDSLSILIQTLIAYSLKNKKMKGIKIKTKLMLQGETRNNSSSHSDNSEPGNVLKCVLDIVSEEFWTP